MVRMISLAAEPSRQNPLYASFCALIRSGKSGRDLGTVAGTLLGNQLVVLYLCSQTVAYADRGFLYDVIILHQEDHHLSQRYGIAFGLVRPSDWACRRDDRLCFSV